MQWGQKGINVSDRHLLSAQSDAGPSQQPGNISLAHEYSRAVASFQYGELVVYLVEQRSQAHQSSEERGVLLSGNAVN